MTGRTMREIPEAEMSELRRWQIGRYGEAIAADPECAEAYVERGAAYHLLELRAEAVADMRRAFELEPADPHLYEMMAWPFEDGEARTILRAGLRRVASGTRIHRMLRDSFARTYWYDGDYQKYVELLEQAIPTLGSEPQEQRLAWNKLGNGYTALGQHEKAEAAYRAAHGVEVPGRALQDPQLIVRAAMHGGDYARAKVVLAEFAGELRPELRAVLGAVLEVLSEPGSPAARKTSLANIGAAKSLAAGSRRAGSASYYSFLGGVLHLGAGRTAEARDLLQRFAAEAEANATEWRITLRWEIAKARELAQGS
ncbi:MAG: hypothetical protein JXR83_10895 [Deltaproteobacteria bacterium]|nr:hypothetical protein [Deltaproteobacteria bacterium]